MTESVLSLFRELDGLICAFELEPVVQRDRGVLSQGDWERPLWLHFNASNGRTRQWLEQQERIPADARMFLLESDARSRVEFHEGSFCVALGDLHHDFDSDPEGFGSVRLFVDEQLIISLRGHPLKTPDVLRRDLQRGLAVGSTLALFELFIERLAQTFEGVVTHLGEQVDDAEDRILAGRFHAEGVRLGRIRHLIARLRRHLLGDRSALSPLPTQLPPWCDLEQRQNVQQSIDRLAAVAQDLELVQERARLLQEEIAGRVSEATNRNMFVLSTVTTVLLPVTLITGIFGMNVSGLPFAERPSGFWWVLLAIVLAIAVSLSLLHKRRLL